MKLLFLWTTFHFALRVEASVVYSDFDTDVKDYLSTRQRTGAGLTPIKRQSDGNNGDVGEAEDNGEQKNRSLKCTDSPLKTKQSWTTPDPGEMLASWASSSMGSYGDHGKLGRKVGKLGKHGFFGYYKDLILIKCEPPPLILTDSETNIRYIPRNISRRVFDPRCEYFDEEPPPLHPYWDEHNLLINHPIIIFFIIFGTLLVIFVVLLWIYKSQDYSVQPFIDNSAK